MDRKRDKRMKLAHYVGRTKQLEIFSLFNIVTDHKHHILCANCSDRKCGTVKDIHQKSR
jgi:hypothetical protein